MHQKNFKGLFLGALIGTLAGSVGAVLLPNRETLLSKIKNQGLANSAFTIGENIIDGIKNMATSQEEKSNTVVTTAVMSLIVGAGTALLLAPKTGKQLRRELKTTYNSVANKTQKFIDLYNHQQIARLRPAIRRAARAFKKPLIKHQQKAKSHA